MSRGARPVFVYFAALVSLWFSVDVSLDHFRDGVWFFGVLNVLGGLVVAYACVDLAYDDRRVEKADAA